MRQTQAKAAVRRSAHRLAACLTIRTISGSLSDCVIPAGGPRRTTPRCVSSLAISVIHSGRCTRLTRSVGPRPSVPPNRWRPPSPVTRRFDRVSRRRSYEAHAKVRAIPRWLAQSRASRWSRPRVTTAARRPLRQSGEGPTVSSDNANSRAGVCRPTGWRGGRLLDDVSRGWRRGGGRRASARTGPG